MIEEEESTADENQTNALTKADMAEALFDQLGLNKREARELVDLFFEELRAALSSGAQVKLSGFGNLICEIKISVLDATLKPVRRSPSAPGGW